jgi:predicted transcriptional regulator
MVRDPMTVAIDMPLERFVEDVFLSRRHTAYPVRDDGEIVGILSVRDVLALPRSEWAELSVADRMIPRQEALVLDENADLAEAMRDLGGTDVRRALVLVNGRIQGLLSMTDAARTFEVLAGEDIGYLGGRPVEFAKPSPAAG